MHFGSARLKLRKLLRDKRPTVLHQEIVPVLEPEFSRIKGELTI
jgi:hypothetical protein